MPTDYLVLRLETKIKLENPSSTLKPFLNQHTKLERRDMFLKALDSCWLVPAMQESNQYSKDLIKRQGLTQILNLQQQINYLCLLLDLDPRSFQHYSYQNLAPYNNNLNSKPQNNISKQSEGEEDTKQTLLPTPEHLTDNME